MATPTTKRPVRQLSIQEKLSAIQRVHNGESKASVARLIGVPESTLRGWCKNEVKLRGMLDKTLSFTSTSPPPPDKKQKLSDGPEVEDALWFWMRNQQQQEASRNLINNNNDNNNHSSWFWRWYKQYGVPNKTNSLAELENTNISEEPIPLVKRHCKETGTTVLSDINKETKENKLSLESTGTLSEDEDDTPPTAADALKHGEMFLRWLECCSDPSVTAVQLLQFRYLLNNVKSCAQRKAANKSRSPSRSRRK